MIWTRYLKLSLMLFLGVTIYTLFSQGQSTGEIPPNPYDRVVLITIDGVRREELMGQLDLNLDPRVKAPSVPMPFLWESLQEHGAFIGLPDSPSIMTVANSEIISLPAYMSLMAGRPQPCLSNSCGQIYMSKTLPERLVQEAGFAPKDVATFSSWSKIRYAIETVPGTTTINAGPGAQLIGIDHDSQMESIISAAQNDPPLWNDARYDKYTAALALRYYDLYRPKFLYISLNDTDEWAHRGQYLEHLQAMQHADQLIKDVVARLVENDQRHHERSCLLITTDHGRGTGANWSRHSNGQLYAGLIWAYSGCDFSHRLPLLGSVNTTNGTNGKTHKSSAGTKIYTHLDIRPTIENWFGLRRRPCTLCGREIREFIEEKRQLGAADQISNNNF